MADIIDPSAILAGDKASANPMRRLAPGVPLQGFGAVPSQVLSAAISAASTTPIDRNLLAIEATLAAERTFMLHCVELNPHRSPGDDYSIAAFSHPGEFSGPVHGLAAYIRGKLHQRFDLEANVGITQALQLVFTFTARELRL